MRLLVLTVFAVVCVSQVVLSADTDIYFLHVTSDISFRFASTRMRSQIANAKTEAQEISFNVQLPKAAFIANFSMEIDGVVYPGNVKEKEQAKREYDQAKKRGQSAGHVAAAPRNTNKFSVSVNVAAQSKVTFDLLYQELLERRLGVYEHVVNVNPGQVVRDLRITVNLHESREITSLRVPPIRNEIQNTITDETATNERAVITREAPNKATIVYEPTVQEQEAASAQGMTGQFLVQYDVARSRDGGEVQVVDGYFVHFISPSDVAIGDKAILFILDVSGSMAGQKMNQVHDAMSAILVQLRPGDYVNMLKFSGGVDFWQNQMQNATAQNINKATRWALRLRSTGSTNINGAVTQGTHHVAQEVHRLSAGRTTPLSPIVIFLTDGLPSAGETNINNILNNVKGANEGRVTLFSLGFGGDVDFNFLKKMSLQNKGFARKIYTGSDASLQLQGFYQEVASPVLSDVTVEYLDDAADNETLTNSLFQTYFKGTELVVAGSLSDITSNQLVARVSGQSAEGPLVFNTITTMDGRTGSILTDGATALDLPSPADLQDKIERMWAYLTIKEILEKQLETSDKDEKEQLKQRALEMSLRYNFVTPVTSMIVTKPEEDPVSEGLEEEGDGDTRDSSRARPPQSPGRQSQIPGSIPLPQALPAPNNYGSRRGFADNDPHFVVSIDGSIDPVCFDVQGNIGDIYQLVYDPIRKITVNGMVVGKVNPNKGKQKTYFGEIAIIANGTRAILDPRRILVNHVEHKWKKSSTFRVGPVSFYHVTKHMLKISLGNDVILVVMRHLVGKSPSKVDFMGIYIEEDEGLSAEVHGLLGQFKDLRVRITEHPGHHGNKTTGTMTFPQSSSRKSVTVRQGSRLNMATKAHMRCWYVRHNGKRLIDGKIQNYRVGELLHSQMAPGLRKRFRI